MLEDVPADLKGRDETKGEASLKGHLLNGTHEQFGSQAYVPPDEKNDKQLIAAEDLLRGIKRADAASSETPAPGGSVTPAPAPAPAPTPAKPATPAAKPATTPDPGAGKTP